MKGNIYIIVFLACLLSCKKTVSVDPPVTNPVGGTVYETNSTAISVLSGVYAAASNINSLVNGKNGLSLYAGLSADELQTYPDLNSFLSLLYTNNITSREDGIAFFWRAFYIQLYTLNTAIEGISASNGLSVQVKNELLGEAKFNRAFFNFYLVNFFGDVPLITTNDYKANSVAARMPAGTVYKQIIQDLQDAEAALPATYVAGDVQTTTTERVRPNKWVAAALLARVYLYTKDYANALAKSNDVIGQTNLYKLVGNLDSVFLKNSTEAIWQLQPVDSKGANAPDGAMFILTAPPTANTPASLSSSLYNAFEPGDQRKLKWVKSYKAPAPTNTVYYYPYKYKVGVTTAATPVTEYEMVFRLAEQYLVHAEASVQQGDLSAAAKDLNILRHRAGLPDVSAVDKDQMLKAVEQERRIELFSELGHRWFDLKRTGRVDAVMSVETPKKGGVWSTNWQLFPIPLSELHTDLNLTQNTGY
ncbi:RagB/SusD family nutrient uptake outer membrane protein [Deminuibacter soli]|uniref:RagB/SusD family nutrient uptake outer membrane protein n=1 Tax=Deminuibacter soli TaxID=2291815 RepID=A0A3E1NKC2_9BACT|nr:RagB/SusD family nutrient uptake outer membrane protein [Deminuibacter soli]RFM28228.1 RagB/SusD family nutrient uptake outer membrane protein [Deminuibacter soli]